MNDKTFPPPLASPDALRLCEEGRPDLPALWDTLKDGASQIAAQEPQLRPLLTEVFLEQDSLPDAISIRLVRKLAREDMRREELLPILHTVFEEHPELVERMARDLLAIFERDPACHSPLQPLLYFKGFLAISTYRIANQLYLNGRVALAYYFQSLTNEMFSVDIHPAARIGCGILLDHASSFVVGETAIIEDDVSILHEVTLGGTGKETGDRHPIVRSGVMIGAGAKILGRVEIGKNAKVGAGSVVLADVPPHKTVAGVPAEVVGESSEENPAAAMDQSLRCAGL